MKLITRFVLFGFLTLPTLAQANDFIAKNLLKMPYFNDLGVVKFPSNTEVKIEFVDYKNYKKKIVNYGDSGEIFRRFNIISINNNVIESIDYKNIYPKYGNIEVPVTRVYLEKPAELSVELYNPASKRYEETLFKKVSNDTFVTEKSLNPIGHKFIYVKNSQIIYSNEDLMRPTKFTSTLTCDFSQGFDKVEFLSASGQNKIKQIFRDGVLYSIESDDAKVVFDGKSGKQLTTIDGKTTVSEYTITYNDKGYPKFIRYVAPNGTAHEMIFEYTTKANSPR